MTSEASLLAASRTEYNFHRQQIKTKLQTDLEIKAINGKI